MYNLFNCVCIIKPVSKHKFDDKLWKGILVGYALNGFRVCNTECEKYETVRDVIVDETHCLQSRPLIKPEGSNNKYSQNKTGSDLVSKPVCLRSPDMSISKLDNSKSNEKRQSV